MSFTKGPWEIDSNTMYPYRLEDRHLHIRSTGSKGYALATVNISMKLTDSSLQKDAISVAISNAELIAAAPDLLSESKRLLKMLKEHYPKAYNTIAVGELEMVIAKAEGREI